jgi:hypothetical protein
MEFHENQAPKFEGLPSCNVRLVATYMVEVAAVRLVRTWTDSEWLMKFFPQRRSTKYHVGTLPPTNHDVTRAWTSDRLQRHQLPHA